MTAVTSALVRLYPRAWRQRYGPEMQELLDAEKPSLRTYADLIAGAVDARLNPQTKPAECAGRKEGNQMVNLLRCAPAGVSVADQFRSAGWMIGGSIILTGISLILQQQIGRNAFSEGLLYSAFPASLMLSSECTYLKRYSPAARTVMSIGGAVFIIGLMWAAVVISYRI